MSDVASVRSFPLIMIIGANLISVDVALAFPTVMIKSSSVRGPVGVLSRDVVCYAVQGGFNL